MRVASRVRTPRRSSRGQEPGAQTVRCGACGVHFRTVGLFDRHRTGRGEYGGCLPVVNR